MSIMGYKIAKISDLASLNQYDEEELKREEEESVRPFVPPKSGMSPAALRRCRTLVVAPIGDPEDHRQKITVYSPGPNERVLDTLIVRTPQDLSRVMRSYRAKYRIPSENVTVLSDE
jgi:hypothetical protein